MASKKVYAVKKGKTPGIFYSWEECRLSVDGYPGAVYKGFSTLAEAQYYLGEEHRKVTEGNSANSNRKRNGEGHPVQLPKEGVLLAYVDGSYQDGLQKYAFGCVFLLPDGRIYVEYGNGDNPDSMKHRNVTGEMLGAMYATKTAMANGFGGIEICYDYEGIEKWVTGAWRSKTELTLKYANAMREWSKAISIRFTKVPAHSNVFYNELADELAKKGLTEGNGIPKIRPLADMTEYNPGEDASKMEEEWNKSD